jgi:hypothetical protein
VIASAQQLPIEVVAPEGPLPAEAVELVADWLLGIVDDQAEQLQGNGGGKRDTPCRFLKEGSGND